MKLRQLSSAAFVALVIAAADPSVLHADTIYCRQADASGIRTISGTIVRETDTLVEIRTANGRKVSIARQDVFEIVRDTTPTPQKTAGPADGLQDFPAASALARGETGDDFRSGSGSIYHYGFMGGLASSNVRADPQDLEEGGSLRGYTFGFWYGVPLTRRLLIRPELLFSMKGDSESAAGYTASTHLGYIELPVLARLTLLPDAAIQPSFFAGPSLAVNLSAHAKLEGEGREAEVDVKDQVAGLDFGLVAGGGLGFVVGGKTLGVDLRYARGFGDVADGVIGSAHNEALAVMLSIGLR